MAGVVESIMFENVEPTLNDFYSSSTSNIASYISEPFAALATLAIIISGIAMLSGQLEISFKKFLTTSFMVGALSIIALSFSVYDDLLGHYLRNLPDEMLTITSGAFVPVGPTAPGEINVQNGAQAIDEMYDKTQRTVAALYSEGGIGLTDSNLAPYLYGFVLFVLSLVVVVIMTVALIMLKVGITLITILGPLFILGLLFASTREYFTKWLTFATQFIVAGALLGVYLGLSIDILNTQIDDLAAAETYSDMLSAAAPLFIFLPVITILFLSTTSYAASLSGGFASSLGMGIVSRASSTMVSPVKRLASLGTRRAVRGVSESRMAHRQVRIQNKARNIRKKQLNKDK